MRFALFFALIFLLLGGLGYYIRRRASREFNLSAKAQRALTAFFAAGLVALIASRALSSLLPDVIARALGTAGSVVMVALVIASILLAVVDIPRALIRLAARVSRQGRRPMRGFAPTLPLVATPDVAPSVVDSPSTLAEIVPSGDDAAPPPAQAPGAEPIPLPEPLPRRTFLTQAAAGSAFFIGGGGSLYGALYGRHDYAIEEVAIPIPGLPKSLDGYTLVQLSDIHIGLYVADPELRAAEELVRKARPDMVVLTGDLIDFNPRYVGALGGLVRRLGPLAREGVAAIPGNHDYFTGIDEILSTLKAAGADVLRNRGRVIGAEKQGFALLGVDDVWAARLSPPQGGPDLARAIATVPRDLPRVLLCHNPVFFPEAADHVALQLSGHTHGGQVNMVVRPADLVLPHGYVAGQYQRGASRLYINRGFGTAGPPIRIGAPPEVTKIVLVSA